MINALLINLSDNVAVVTEQVQKGGRICYMYGTEERTVAAAETIPVFHKTALCDIEKGQEIYKYGCRIGIATSDIRQGEHVHCHNVRSPDARVDR